MTRWITATTPESKALTIGVDKNKHVEVTTFPDARGLVEAANGTRNVRYCERSTAVVGNAWFAVGFYDLTTTAWNGTTWVPLVDAATGKKLFSGPTDDDRIMAIASDGTRAWAVSCAGSVYEWTGKTWEPKLPDGGELFAGGRRFARVAWDHKGSRLVLWGGQTGNRSSNDTLLIDGATWRKSKKPGTKLAARKADNYWLYDDHARGGIVRIGPEGCALLDGDAWKPLDLAPPTFVSADPDASAASFVIAHDPASKRTLWLDPLAGRIYREGQPAPIAEVGLPPGMVSTQVLKDAGGYFSTDFELANEHAWLWGWNPAERRAYAMRPAARRMSVRSRSASCSA